MGSEDVFLVCEHHTTVDDKGGSPSTTGSDTFKNLYLNGTDEKNITIKKVIKCFFDLPALRALQQTLFVHCNVLENMTCCHG